MRTPNRGSQVHVLADVALEKCYRLTMERKVSGLQNGSTCGGKEKTSAVPMPTVLQKGNCVNYELLFPKNKFVVNNIARCKV
jgi:hypothetical protein